MEVFGAYLPLGASILAGRLLVSAALDRQDGALRYRTRRATNRKGEP